MLKVKDIQSLKLTKSSECVFISSKNAQNDCLSIFLSDFKTKMEVWLNLCGLLKTYALYSESVIFLWDLSQKSGENYNITSN